MKTKDMDKGGVFHLFVPYNIADVLLDGAFPELLSPACDILSLDHHS